MKQQTYIIGKYEFDSYREYRDAQEDLQKIEIINRDLNVHDPEVAIRLYNMIRSEEIRFASPIGEEFVSHVADIVADKSVNLLDNKTVVEEADKKVRRQRRLGFFIVTLALAFAVIFGYSQLKDVITARRMEQRAAEAKASETLAAQRQAIEAQNAEALRAAEAEMSRDPFAETTPVDESTLTVLPEYTDLAAENPDFVGWLTVEGTQVDYPVVQGDDNEYYLNRDFDKKEDNNGSLFVDYRSNIVNPTTNTIIYGHNMKSGLMFGSLKNYLREDFYEEHQSISFHTLYVEKEYEIVAVCLTKVADQDDTDFRYYNFIQASNEAEWDAFVENIKSLSLFSDDVDLKAGDEVLTLSTCNSYTEDGRLFLVAKRIN